jgi:hypothetical protein
MMWIPYSPMLSRQSLPRQDEKSALVRNGVVAFVGPHNVLLDRSRATARGSPPG